MDIFIWDETMESGVPEIDRQHRTLFTAANELHEAILAGEGGGNFHAIKHVFHTETLRHFRREESLMRETGYPLEEAHRQEHRRFEDLLERMVSEEEAPTAFQVLQVLNSMIRGHIVEVDLPMLRWVRSISDPRSLDAIRPSALNPGDH
ncbi:MAG TPA: hemerythrin family protein [Fibrobacteria bacterium]|nr:hemerythrin family protein [Fibrobacteria bacterium]